MTKGMTEKCSLSFPSSLVGHSSSCVACPEVLSEHLVEPVAAVLPGADARGREVLHRAERDDYRQPGQRRVRLHHVKFEFDRFLTTGDDRVVDGPEPVEDRAAARLLLLVPLGHAEPHPD